MNSPLIVPNAEPFFFPGGRTGCLLIHGFTSMPEEMRPCGEFLSARGYTVLGIRLAGHATHPNDLGRTKWQDWLVSVEEGLTILRASCDHVVLIGQSMGGTIALLSTTCYPINAAVAISTPYDREDDWRLRTVRLWSSFIPVILKGKMPITNFKLDRREKDYPAYPFFPTKILAEVEDLKKAMHAALSEIKTPVLVIQSKDDPTLNEKNADQLFQTLKTPHKDLFWLENAGHSIVLDPQRDLAFNKICQFLDEVNLYA